MELLKVATAARYFKEAARISIKAKLLYVEKKTIQIDMNMIILKQWERDEEYTEKENG